MGIEENKTKKDFSKYVCLLFCLGLMLSFITSCTPQAKFEFDYSSGIAPLVVTFNNLSSNADEYRWDFGDGNTNITYSKEEFVRHEYTKVGVYSVSLTTISGEEKTINTVTKTEVIEVKPGPLATIDMQPKEVSMSIHGTQQYNFKAYDEFGNRILDSSATWSVPREIGSIDENGLFTAGLKAGSYSKALELTVVAGSSKISTAGDISILPDPLYKIDVQPSALVLDFNDVQPLMVKGYDSYGNEIPDLDFSWEASGGTITQEGVFTAGREEQVVDVTVRAVDKQNERSSSSRIIVTSDTLAEMGIITGQILFNKKPISNYTDIGGHFWVRDETTKKSFPDFHAIYNRTTGAFAIFGFPPGTYYIQVNFNSGGRPNGYAGDFECSSLVTISQSMPIIRANIAAIQAIHLVSPIDNSQGIGSIFDPKDTYPANALMFRWEPIEGATEYRLRIDRVKEPYQTVKSGTTQITTENQWKPTLDPSLPGEFYVLTIQAINSEGDWLGGVRVYYTGGGYGWDYRFRIE